ncbi:molybdopterin-guanine dinucleotide biosynthesis protein B [Sulfobacillus harzensis]|uniref:Molybdopterin-guanine dinucleotide biosynthesis protein B (MobB) domain-containing protein n=1 Tax=Sulfobacillus harzensis TaxID=2729629 RepID=A0A7Y0L285_9FIRM|nr:molybdopterin-guanine dinucleotide biosynthesis protein MobB [Sulfobacillus harzensis]NMP21972.1 hypothetical protein [Sulfobacillus harzensis]
MRVLHFAGPSGVGKTRLIEALLVRLPGTLVVKWSHHPLPPDEPERDTTRFQRHGVGTWFVTPTGIVERRVLGPEERAALYTRLAREAGTMELVLIEGDKWAPYPKIWLGNAPPPTMQLALVIGPDKPRGAHLPWIPMPLPLEAESVNMLAERISHRWREYSYELSQEGNS